jgi:tetratricopeptide (TPR) repeat protein
MDPRRDLLLAGLLLAAVFLAYLPAIHGGLLLDDDLHITRPALQSVGGLGRIWFDVGATQQYYPVVHTAFWLEHRLWGDSVAGYHLVNILFHACAAGLVVLLMRRLRLPGGWLAAFLFALHPVCVESVAWIAEQKNTLSTLLALGATLAYLRFDEERNRTQFWIALGLFALALLGKTAVVTLPVILLVAVWWRRPRLGWSRDVRPLLLWSVLGGAIGLITLGVERRLLAGIHADFTLTPSQRVLLAGRAFWFYAGKLVWPANLTFFYPRWAVNTAAGWQVLYPLAAGVLAVALGYLAQWRKGPLAALLCFVAALFPILGFFDVEWFGFSFVADHFQYLASLGLIIPLAAVLTKGAGRLPAAGRRLAPVAACILLATLGALTWRQCGRYRDPVTFYRTAAELSPDSAVAHNHFGAALAVLPGRMPEAIDQFEAALRLSPNFAEIHENLGTALLRDPARITEAVAHLETACRLRPDRKSAHDKLAYALAGIPGRLPEAIGEYQVSLRMDPNDPIVHYAFGLALMLDPNRLADAEAQFKAALRLKPDFADAENELGIALASSPGRLPEAIAHFEAAVRIDPGMAGARANLRNARQLLERMRGAPDH